MTHPSAKVRIESPQGIDGIIEHYILQQRMRRKILSLKLDWAKFNTREFKDIYSGVVLDMSYERLLKLSELTDETDIVLFLRRKSNNKEKTNQTEIHCDEKTNTH
jgi:hypothetical protein